MIKLGVLGSTNGTDSQAILNAIAGGMLDAEITVVISNKAKAYILERAQKHNVSAFFISHKDKTREEFDALVDEYGEEKFPDLGIKYNDSLMLKRPVGCNNCEGTGYSGRTGLYELLNGTTAVKTTIMKNSTVDVIREQAISEGMTTLKQDGIYKVFKGDCDLKHVNAVCLL